jgi:excisionase family DNA binding protein
MDKLLDIGELSEILGVTKATIYSWTSQNKIPHIKLSKRLLKFREKEIIDWITAKSVTINSMSPAENKNKHYRNHMFQQQPDDSIERIIQIAKEKMLHKS